MFDQTTIKKLNKIPTPFYYYDTGLLKQTLDTVVKESSKYGFIVHYALKANANSKILTIIKDYGLGADCVSGNEVVKAISSGFKREDVVFAGVGKSDAEINVSLNNDIACFNCESVQEMEVINELAGKKQKQARIAIRINPNVDAKTHRYITTGLEENKFGLNKWDLDNVLAALEKMPNLKLTGVHFHIGSQITDLTTFKGLCLRVNELQEWFENRNIKLDHINVGGGLGVDYKNPDDNRIPDFASYFNIFNDFLELRPTQKLHFELGRALVAHSGDLLTRVIYVKHGVKTKFAIVDAGMTELIRPALYQSYHQIENLSKNGTEKNMKYDVVGPICESSDCFGKAVNLPETKRGDLIAIRTTGAYGQVMSSQYNLRELAKTYYSDEL